MNFTFILSPEKTKEFTAVEDAYKPKITLDWEMLRNVGKWGQATLFKKTAMNLTALRSN